MKNLLLSLAFWMSYFASIFAQCTPVDCSASLPAYGGICDTLLVTGLVNTPYSDSESFVITDNCFDAGLIDPTQAGTAVKIINVDNFSFSGLPVGITAATNMSAYAPPSGSYTVGCFGATGTPIEAGTFAATANFLADVRAYPFGGGNCSGFSLVTNDNPSSYALQLIVLPDASFTGLTPIYCELDPPVSLTVSGTLGGTFSGPGITGNMFDPATASPGTHLITYTVTAQEGAAIAPATNTSTFSVTVNPSVTYYADTDSDTFGDSTNAIVVCGPAPTGYVADNTDCDDLVGTTFPGATEICDGIDNNCDGNTDEGIPLVTYYLDSDGDTFGDPANSVTNCSGAPANYVADNTDCDDSNVSIFPGATEICDGIDNNCDSNTDEGLPLVTYYLDSDGDNYGDPSISVTNCSGAPAGYVIDNTDCNDSNSALSPGATEVCDGIDNNCDGNTDEGLTFITYYIDSDNDTYGDPATSVTNCSGAPAGYVTDNTDCNDSVATIFPGATETCDGIDNNCEGNTDEGLTFVTYYLDNDGDNFGNSAASVTNCSGAPAGYVTDDTDCDDGNAAIFPGATEICDGVDNNCDNNTDEGLVFTTYYQDSDGDNYGNPAVIITNCSGAPAGYVTDNTDCDDTNSAISPGAVEICDGIDNNCDSNTDEGLVFTTYYLDSDGDSYGDLAFPTTNCSGAPIGYVADSTDCDDMLANINPGALEIPGNGVDENCDGVDGSIDNDGDLFDSTVDCNDSDNTVYPGAPELCDGQDNDCNNMIDEGLALNTYYLDSDGDSYGDAANPTTTCSAIPPMGYVANSMDCNDNNSAINPGATEICDGIDNNCNNNTDEGLTLLTYYLDSDGDGAGDLANPTSTCAATPPTGYVANSMDCNDNNSAINPGAAETCDGIDNNCDGNIDEGIMLNTYYLDNDSDGNGDPAVSIATCALTAPAGYVANSMDCDDTNSAINPDATEICDGVDNNCDGNIDEGLNATTYFLDNDNDGNGDPAISLTTCNATPPAGYVTNSSDCNDNNPSINPDATEICDGIDNNCDGNVDEGLPVVTYYFDNDGDGFGNPISTITNCATAPPAGYVVNNTDCDDLNSSINPGATEICDGIDNNCDGNIDEGILQITYYLDSDNDGNGDPNISISSCATQAPTGYSSNFNDCDDTNPSINPDAMETCDGIDNNCDGNIDEGLALATYFLDSDGDGFGTGAATIMTCAASAPAGYAVSATDCDDNNPAINPSASETCDGVDNNCNGSIDEGLATNTYYLDSDNDGYGDINMTTTTCSATAPIGYIGNAMDCDDTDVAVNPGATEVCDGIDNNCDGNIDEGLAVNTYYEDGDSDGFGAAANSIQVCSATAPSGYAADDTDCDDSNGAIYPGATEIVNNGIDEDCDGMDLLSNTIDLEDVFGLSVYPNPAHSSLFISGNLEEEFLLEVIDIQGRKVYTAQIQDPKYDVLT